MRCTSANITKVVAFILHSLVIFSACQTVSDIEDQSEPTAIIKNSFQTDARIQIPQNETLVPINEVAESNPSGRTITQPPEDLNYVLVLRAGIDPPQWENNLLQASHVTVANGLAYVTYNTQGESFVGGLDIINISNPLSPTLEAQAIFPDTEFSSVAVDGDTIYLTGGQLDEGTLSSPAVVKIMTFSKTDGLTEISKTIDLPSYVGTDIKVDQGFIYVTYGNSGGLSIYDKTSRKLVKQLPLDDARSLVVNDENVMVMQGSPARVSVVSKAVWEVTQSYSTEGANNAGAKSIFDLSDEALYLPAGEEGLKILSRNNGSILQHFPLPTMGNVETKNIVSNAVTKNKDKLFTANGAAGMYVLHQVDNSYQLFGSVDFEASTNFVVSQENLMFVATGTKGLNIIEIVEYNPEEGDFITIGEWDEYGRPDYLCESESGIDTDISARLQQVFLASDDLTIRQPEWFTESVLTDILLKEDTDVEIMIWGETTHHQNSVGYYSYASESRPENPSDLQDMTIVFPNATITSSGSHLMQGDKVCLADFSKNTQLGFFLAYKGFVDGEVTTGYKMHYSSRWLNKYRPIKQQNIILAVPEQQTLVLAFEDVQRPYHDQDFDDGIFLIKFSNPNAVDWSAFLELP